MIMTAACGGGTSSLKAGVGGSVIFDAALITAGLGLISPFLLPFAGLVDAFTYEALSQCGSDPPAMPSSDDLSPTNAIGGILNPNFQTWLTAVHNLLLNYAWQQYCQCDTGGPPTFTYPPPPAGIVVTNNPTNQPCFQGAYSGEAPTFSGADPSEILLSALPAGAVTTHSYLGGNSKRVAIPAGAYTSVVWDMTQTGGTGATNNTAARWGFWDASETFTYSPVITFLTFGGATFSQHITTTIPATAVNIAFWAGNTVVGDAQPNVDSCITKFVCAGSSLGSPCSSCPPDATLTQLLNTILQAVNNNYSQINLIQRQAVPFAYVTGASHAGLSGSGEITFSDILGIKVNPSSIPPSAGVDVGDPDSLWLDSWIRWGNPDGWTQREFLTSAPFVSFPAVAGQYTRVGYTLRPGLSVDILELVREP